MKTELYNYDIFPKVVPSGNPTGITIRPRGLQSAFPEGELQLMVCPLHERDYPLDGRESSIKKYGVKADADGAIRFCHAFTGEQEHFIRVFDGDRKLCQLSVYSVFEDLNGLMPFIGDLHLHTIRSDGHEDPATVAAHLRQKGYDFIAITDHRNFSGSLEAIDAYKSAPIGLSIMTGEEVHLPDCPLHVVHVGGNYSVNAMLDENYEQIDKRNPGMSEKFPQAWKKGCGSDFPGTMTSEQFHREVNAYADTLGDIPKYIPRFAYAGFSWICDQIKKAGGMPIFPHPYWIDNMYHADEKLTEYIFEKKPFDAFEVLGGEMYFEQNGFQTAHYYEAREKFGHFPVVGSSDSHSSVNNKAAFIARTLCFAKSSGTDDVLSAIKGGMSVAVDAISAEMRLIGDYRLIKYGWFLLENYFPLHDEACFEQGRAMMEYYSGDREEGLKMLSALDGRIEKMMDKYFAF